ncbi:MAG: Ppx/GppA family phosphatase, partial [Cypionkella sp.]|nr:Ppx/GppA family phosphatase [Cypionkella sp.]
MAPERPLGADAMQTAVEAPRAFRETDPSAPPGLWSKGLYAAVDLGTNACRMLIAQPRGSQFVVVDSFSKTVQLGAGL